MAEARRFLFDRVPTPVGVSVIVADEDGALRFHYWEDESGWERSLRHRYGDVTLVAQKNPFGHSAALTAYMEGDIHVLDTVAVAFTGTPFQLRVWNALRAIPGGTTLSYGALAKRIGDPKAVRAVGLANGANPIGVIVPCHRVIGTDGSLTGYGGGIERKRWLLAHEARHAGQDLFAKENSR